MRDSGMHFRSFDEWQTWADGQRRGERAFKSILGRATRENERRPRVRLYEPPSPARVLVVIDQRSPSCDLAAVEPLRHLDPTTTAVLAPEGVAVPGIVSEPQPFVGAEQLQASITAVLSLGAYLGVSRAIHPWARAHDVRFALVQHGLLTPWAPPAPEGAHVLAWSDADAEYWTHERPDLSVDVVGSQMLWSASQRPTLSITSDRPVMLGQLHGTELSRADALRAYLTFARAADSDYRPHPNEADAVSRVLHRVMARRGVTFETSGLPLLELERPVVSIFSTGTLEAAQRGIPSWVHHPSPKPWVRDFWRRYGLAEWGSEPTPAWDQPDEAPALTIARALEDR